LADLNRGDTLAHFDHFADAVGAGDEREGLTRIVVTANHHEVTEIEGDGACADANLARSERGGGSFGEVEVIETELGTDLEDAHEQLLDTAVV